MMLCISICSALALGGCAAKTYTLSPTSLTPAAAGLIEIDVDDNGNRVLTLEVDHLPELQDLGEGLTVYVVWVRPKSGDVYQNQGRIVIDDERHGELEFKVPYRKMQVIISAEQDPAALKPGGHVILQGQVKLPKH
jgi:hypothetical protein